MYQSLSWEQRAFVRVIFISYYSHYQRREFTIRMTIDCYIFHPDRESSNHRLGSNKTHTQQFQLHRLNMKIFIVCDSAPVWMYILNIYAEF